MCVYDVCKAVWEHKLGLVNMYKHMKMWIKDIVGEGGV